MMDTRREVEAQRVILDALKKHISAVRRHAAQGFC
jgi:hypothetical protein